jgi:hypothetical protein
MSFSALNFNFPKLFVQSCPCFYPYLIEEVKVKKGIWSFRSYLLSFHISQLESLYLSNVFIFIFKNLNNKTLSVTNPLFGETAASVEWWGNPSRVAKTKNVGYVSLLGFRMFCEDGKAKQRISQRIYILITVEETQDQI